MPRRYTLHVHPDAVRAIYTISRGVAAKLTEAIRTLEHNPIPEDAIPVPGRPDRFELRVLGYVVLYEVSDEQRAVTILIVDIE